MNVIYNKDGEYMQRIYKGCTIFTVSANSLDFFSASLKAHIEPFHRMG